MKALILNSGIGSRMGVLTSEHPKCMTEIFNTETILSRQLKQLADVGIENIVITTGLFDSVLINYCNSLNLPLHITFAKNPLYDKTNYIYSIYCAREYLNDDIILMHGDMVFENEVLDMVMSSRQNCMTVSSVLELPEKDFKAVIRNGRIEKIGIEFFNEAMAAQPLYKLNRDDFALWLAQIERYVENHEMNCYAENAYNDISDRCHIYPLDVRDMLCNEIDDASDYAVVSSRVKELENRLVYMCFSTDILHSGHMEIIRKAKRLGKLVIGVLSDEAVANYKRYPLMPFSERKSMFENVMGVYSVVEQKTLSYRDNIRSLHPAVVVHGDDWTMGFQKPVRDEVVSELAVYGGRLVEFPYSAGRKYEEIERNVRAELALPSQRIGRLRRSIHMKGLITALEAHSGITGLIAEKSSVYQDGEVYQFDAMWISSFCDSTAKGKPDIELVDISSRLRTIDDIMEVTTKPLIFDGNTGGPVEHFTYTVKTLERMGVSMIVIGDQSSAKDICDKISAGKKAQKTEDFMICANIELSGLHEGIKDALAAALNYVDAGADAIMIRSENPEPDDIFEFAREFRKQDSVTPIAVNPAFCHYVRENEYKDKDINVVVYANQLTRTGFPAMQRAAQMILKNHRAEECDEICMSIQDILTMIPKEV